MGLFGCSERQTDRHVTISLQPTHSSGGGREKKRKKTATLTCRHVPSLAYKHRGTREGKDVSALFFFFHGSVDERRVRESEERGWLGCVCGVGLRAAGEEGWKGKEEWRKGGEDRK